LPSSDGEKCSSCRPAFGPTRLPEPGNERRDGLKQEPVYTLDDVLGLGFEARCLSEDGSYFLWHGICGLRVSPSHPGLPQGGAGRSSRRSESVSESRGVRRPAWPTGASFERLGYTGGASGRRSTAIDGQRRFTTESQRAQVSKSSTRQRLPDAPHPICARSGQRCKRLPASRRPRRG
jgi:hypothetical protein